MICQDVVDFNITEPSFGTPFMNPMGLVDAFGSGRFSHPKTKRYPSVCDLLMSVETSPVSRNRWTLSSFMLDFVSPKRRLRIEKLSRSWKGSSFCGFLGRCFAIKRIQSHRNGRPQTLHVRKKNRWTWPKNLLKPPETVLNGQFFSTLRLMVVSGQIHQPTKVNRRSYEVGVVMFGRWYINASWQ